MSVFQAQRELGVLLTEPTHCDMQRAVTEFTKAAEQQVLFLISTLTQNSQFCKPFFTLLTKLYILAVTLLCVICGRLQD